MFSKLFSMAQNRRNIIAIFAVIMEYYDVFLYAYFAPFIVPNFFPSATYLQSVLAILICYLFSPLGAIIFGHIGDRRGRKNVLVWIILILSLSSSIICILPTYHQIGVSASILFIILRIMHGIAMGGGGVGLSIYISEESPRHQRGLSIGLITMGAGIGALMASMAVAVINPYDNSYSFMLWRIPLIITPLGLIVAVYFHVCLEETCFFHKRTYGKVDSWPIVILLKKHKWLFFKIFCLAVLGPIINVVIYGFIPIVLIKQLHFSNSFGMWINTFGLFLFSLLAIVAGILSDRIGRKPIMLFVSLFLMIFGYPLFLLLNSGNVFTVFSVHILLIMVSSIYYCLEFIIAIEAFPKNVRYTGTALTYVLPYIIFGGITGNHILKLILNRTHSLLSPGYFLVFGSIITFAAMCAIKESFKKQLD